MFMASSLFSHRSPPPGPAQTAEEICHAGRGCFFFHRPNNNIVTNDMKTPTPVTYEYFDNDWSHCDSHHYGSWEGTFTEGYSWMRGTEISLKPPYTLSPTNKDPEDLRERFDSLAELINCMKGEKVEGIEICRPHEDLPDEIANELIGIELPPGPFGIIYGPNQYCFHLLYHWEETLAELEEVLKHLNENNVSWCTAGGGCSCHYPKDHKNFPYRLCSCVCHGKE